MSASTLERLQALADRGRDLAMASSARAGAMLDVLAVWDGTRPPAGSRVRSQTIRARARVMGVGNASH